MAINFATPIAHRTDTNYAAFANALARGRPFRQPLQTAPTPANFAPGLEVFLTSAGEVANLYAWLDGTLTWQASTASDPGHRLILTTSPRVLSGTGSLSSLHTLEGKPREAIYENVDQAAVLTALETLISTAYTAAAAAPAAPSNWHPCMRLQVTGGTTTRTLKAYIDNHVPAAATIATLVTGFLVASATAILRVLPVKAGDQIGRAAAYLATDPLPPSPPFSLGTAADANRARRLTFRTTDNNCAQVINPIYYLHIFMRRMLLPASGRIVNSVTTILSGATLNHPLVTLYPPLGNAAVPRAREQISKQTWWPIGDLNTFHIHPTAAANATVEWRYDNAGLFEVRNRTTTANVPMTPSEDQTTKINNLWAAQGAALGTICETLQIPCELVMAHVGTESPQNLDERAVRIEPLLDSNRTQLRTAGVSATDELAYDKLVGFEGNVTAVTLNANGTSTVSITMNELQTWPANDLKKKRLLVGEVDRLEITANTARTKTNATCDITMKDLALSGRFTVGATQGHGATMYYSPSTQAAGNATETAVRHNLMRTGTLRTLRVRAAGNTLDGTTTVTVWMNGATTALTVTLAAGATNGSDTTHTVNVPANAQISIKVVTAGTTGQIRDLQYDLLHAPTTGAAFVLYGYSTSVPNPWTGGTAVRTGTGRTLTWAQLATIVDAYRGLRISPGLIQTLISTAMERLTFLSAIAPGIYATLGVPTPPATASGYLNDWLLHGPRSILMGAAYLRNGYLSKSTCFDVPLTSAHYNSGGIRSSSGSRWGLEYHGDYPGRVGPHMNAAVNLFDGPSPPAVAPTIRFKV